MSWGQPGIIRVYVLIRCSLQRMGKETCKGGGSEGGEEECLRRRTVSETHLDYIYAQTP